MSDGVRRTGRGRDRLATTGIFLVNGLGIGAWASSLPWLRTSLVLSTGRLSLVLLAFAAGAVLAMPAAGRLSPRIGSGRATSLTGLCFAAALLLPTMAGSLTSLILAACLLGAASGGLDVSMNAEASRIERRQGRAIMSSFHAAFSGGGLAGAGLGAALAAGHAQGGTALRIAAALALAAVAAGWTAPGPGSASDGETGLMLPSASVLPLCAAALLCLLCEGAMTDWSAVYLAAIASARPAVAAAGYGAFSAAMLLGRLTGDKILRAFTRRTVVMAGAALAACGLLLAASAPSALLDIGGFAMVGLGLSNVVPAIFSAAGERGAAAGIAMAATAGYAGFLLGPPLIGAIATAFDLRHAMLALAVAAAAILAPAATLRPRPGSRR